MRIHILSLCLRGRHFSDYIHHFFLVQLKRERRRLSGSRKGWHQGRPPICKAELHILSILCDRGSVLGIILRRQFKRKTDIDLGFSCQITPSNARHFRAGNTKEHKERAVERTDHRTEQSLFLILHNMSPQNLGNFGASPSGQITTIGTYPFIATERLAKVKSFERFRGSAKAEIREIDRGLAANLW
jgi:hypothetical protein